MMTLRMIGLVTLGAIMPDTVLAEGQWTLGLGAVGGTSVYEGQKDDVTPIPFLSFETGRLKIGVDGISYAAIRSEGVDLAFTLAPGEAPDVKDFAKRDLRFAGLKRDTPVEIGVNASYQTGMLQFGASLMQDLAGASEGYHAEATAGVSVPVGLGKLDLAMGARLRDAKLNNFLFGVSAAEANGLRPAYDVGSTVQPFLSGSLIVPVSEQAALVGFFEYEKLDGKVTRSPLVDDGADAALDLGLGLLFRF
jgi:outer membrane scaffolding protein for murein synthesis (MipA/OmpV family)